MDRLDEVLRGADPAWHLREINRVLIEEDLGYGTIPIYRDIQKVGDLLRIGVAGLSIRFREVDPSIWAWLIDELEAKRGRSDRS